MIRPRPNSFNTETFHAWKNSQPPNDYYQPETRLGITVYSPSEFKIYVCFYKKNHAVQDQTIDFFEQVPEEVILQICLGLGPQDHSKLTLVSKKWQFIVMNQDLIPQGFTYKFMEGVIQTHATSLSCLRITEKNKPEITKKQIDVLKQKCSHLQQMYIGCKSKGNILDSLSSMTNLTGLGFAWTADLQGKDLNTVAKCTKLRKLEINAFGTCQRSGSFKNEALFQLTTLRNLEVFCLKSRFLTDQGLKVFANFTNLRSCEVESDSILSTGFANFSVLTDLQSLRIKGASIPDAGSLASSSLKNLTLCGKNSILSVTNLPLCIGLQNLNLSGSLNRDANLSPIWTMATLTALNLSRNQFQDEQINNMTSLLSLNSLDFSFCKRLKGTFLDNFSRLVNLSQLSLSGCTLIDGYYLQFMTTNLSLKVLDLSLTQNKIMSPHLRHVGKLTNLKELTLSTSVDDESLAHLSRLVNLEYLEYSGTALTPQGIASFKEKIGSDKVKFVAQKK